MNDGSCASSLNDNSMESLGSSLADCLDPDDQRYVRAATTFIDRTTPLLQALDNASIETSSIRSKASDAAALAKAIVNRRSVWNVVATDADRLGVPAGKLERINKMVETHQKQQVKKPKQK